MTTATTTGTAGNGAGRPQSGRARPAGARRARGGGQRDRSALPPDFDVEAWTREACRRSGVTFAVTDPVVLEKLRVLTRRDE